MRKQFDEKSKSNGENNSDADYAYKNVIKKDMTNRRTFSVISLGLAILSLIFFFIPCVSLILAVFSIAGAAWSRKNLGYFDKISLAAIIIGIFGVVFALYGIIFGGILSIIL